MFVTKLPITAFENIANCQPGAVDDACIFQPQSKIVDLLDRADDVRRLCGKKGRGGDDRHLLQEVIKICEVLLAFRLVSEIN